MYHYGNIEIDTNLNELGVNEDDTYDIIIDNECFPTPVEISKPSPHSLDIIINIYFGIYPATTLASTHSLKISLKGVLEGTDGLDNHKQALLDRVPNSGDWAKVEKDSVEAVDIAFLSAKTGHEFAILKGKKNEI